MHRRKFQYNFHYAALMFLNQARAWFLKITFMRECMCGVCVWAHARLVALF